MYSILFGLATSSVFSQNVVTAKIIDASTQAAVSNAIITVKGDTARFHSNKLGYFQLNADSSDFLIISHATYETGKIKVPARSNFAIQLNPLDKAAVTYVANEDEKGQIVNGYKTGVWEFYELDEIALKIDYDRNEIVYLASDSSEYAVKIDDQFVMTKVDRQPRYLGSESDIYGSIASTIPYPVEARSKGIQGRFDVAFTVGNDGRMQDFQVINNIGGGCGEVAIEALKKIPGTWIPAIVDGTPRPARFVMPFNFVIKGSTSEQPIKAVEKLRMAATYFDEFVVTAIGN